MYFYYNNHVNKVNLLFNISNNIIKNLKTDYLNSIIHLVILNDLKYERYKFHHEFYYMNDKQLIERILDGNLDCFKILIQKYEKKLIRFINQIIFNNTDLCDDILQDTLLKAYKYLKKYDSKYSFKTWLFSIAVNVSKNYLKKQKLEKQKKINLDNTILNNIKDQYHFEPHLFNKELLNKTYTAINSLHPKYQIVISMKYFQKLKIREIAQLLGQSDRNIKYKLNKALKIIKIKLVKSGYNKIDLYGEII